VKEREEELPFQRQWHCMYWLRIIDFSMSRRPPDMELEECLQLSARAYLPLLDLSVMMSYCAQPEVKAALSRARRQV